MSGVFDYLHIKRHTAGSSNELSFDVLDNARRGLDEKGAKSQRLPKPPKAFQGSYHGVEGRATFGGNEEVQRRKKARKVHAIRAWLIAAAVALVVAFGLLWFGYRHYLEVQDFSTRFDSLINQFVEEDAFLAEVDELMAKIDDLSLSKEREETGAKIPAVMEDVERISKNAKSAQPLTVNDQDEVALSQIVDTSASRIEMLKAAQAAFSQANARDARVQAACDIWNEVVDEGQQAKQVSLEANKATTESQTKEARNQTKAVLEKEEATLSKLKELASQYPQVDLSAQIAYIEAKIDSLQYAVGTGDALIKGDRDWASSQNKAYNEADQKAADLAKNLPLSIEEAVCKAYEPLVAESAALYESARDKVIASDSLIRDYIAAR